MNVLRLPRSFVLMLAVICALGCGGSTVSNQDSGVQSDVQSSDVQNLDASSETTAADLQGDALLPDQTGTDTQAADQLDPDAGEVAAETTQPPGPAQVYWDPQSASTATATDLNFFNLPWPEMTRKNPDGTLKMTGFPNPGGDNCTLSAGDPLVGILINTISPQVYRQYVIDVAGKTAKNFGNNTAIYMRFTGALNATLPTPAESLQSNSPIFLINVDEGASDKTHLGERVPVASKVFYTSRYAPPNTLSVMPYPGFPLKPGTTYAMVVLRSLKTVNGTDLGLNDAFELLKGQNPVGAQSTEYKRVFDFLEAKGVTRTTIAAMTVFTTQDPVKLLKSVADRTEQLDITHAKIAVTEVLDQTTYYRVAGTVKIPIFQRSTPPYLPPINSQLVLQFDPNNTAGELLDQPVDTSDSAPDTAPRMEEIPFYLAIDKTLLDNATSKLTVPLALYGHGTGGSKATPYSNYNTTEVSSVVKELLKDGISTFSIDGVMHEDRAHADNLDPSLSDLVQGSPDVLAKLKKVISSGTFFFNPLNLYAGKGNVMQSGVDYIWLAKVLKNTTLTVNGKEVGFSPDQIYFFGHSQGGLTGPLLSLSSHLNALFLSAPGGHLINSLLEKTKPDTTINIKETIRYLVCDTDEGVNLTMHHPVLNAMMTFYEEGDPLNYARHIAYEPFDGRSAKHFFMTEGVKDEHAPPGTNEPISTAAFLNQLGPVIESYDVLGQSYLAALVAAYPTTYPGLDFSLKDSPIMGNLHGGTITAGFRQYAGDHFSFRTVDQAGLDWKYFFHTLLDKNAIAPTIGAP